jgi:hypothetical protein
LLANDQRKEPVANSASVRLDRRTCIVVGRQESQLDERIIANALIDNR